MVLNLSVVIETVPPTVSRLVRQLGARVPGQKGEVVARRRVRGEVLDGRVGGRLPARTVLFKCLGVVQVHLDEVLVEAVGAAVPAAGVVDKGARGRVNVGPDQARERLGGPLGRQEVRLAPLGQLGVGGVARQVGQARPLEDQGAGAGEAVLARVDALGRARVEDDVAGGDAAVGAKGDGQSIGQRLGLRQERVDLGLVRGYLAKGAF